MTTTLRFFDISIDSLCCIAGERFSGEVLLDTSHITKDHSIQLLSKGLELIKVTYPSGESEEYSSQVYTLSSQLQSSFPEGAFQGIIPFTFKIPLYSPSSFDYSDTDAQGRRIIINISYTIEVIFELKGTSEASISKTIFVINRNTRKLLSGSVHQQSTHSCCLCFNRRISHMTISHLSKDHHKCGGIKSYSVLITSNPNQRIIKVKHKVIFEVFILTPNGKSFSLIKELNKTEVEPGDIRRTDQGNGADIVIKVDLGQWNDSKNPCSNNSSLLAAEYKLEVEAEHSSGCNSGVTSCEMQIQVNPDVPLIGKIMMPEDWDPLEYSVKNLLVESKRDISESFSGMISANNFI